MSAPDLIVKKTQLTRQGALPTRLWQLIRDKLLNQAVILLPSDTCYSLAALARDAGARDRIVTILNRKKDPLSLAFPNAEVVERWTKKWDSDLRFCLEQFTPGPITIVCEARDEKVVPNAFTTRGVGSSDRTIGVRIPDSYVEREVAGATQHLITTVAVREPDEEKTAVTDFGRALELVEAGDFKVALPRGWVAIEGKKFAPKHSTVVRLLRHPPWIKLEREGAIEYAKIERAIARIPISQSRGLGMSSSADQLAEIVRRLESNLMVDEVRLEVKLKIASPRKASLMPKLIQELSRLEKETESFPLGISDAQAEDEWDALSHNISEARALRGPARVAAIPDWCRNLAACHRLRVVVIHLRVAAGLRRTDGCGGHQRLFGRRGSAFFLVAACVPASKPGGRAISRETSWNPLHAAGGAEQGKGCVSIVLGGRHEDVPGPSGARYDSPELE